MTTEVKTIPLAWRNDWRSGKMTRHVRGPRGRWAAPLLSLAMLCCIAAIRVSQQPTHGNPQAYHDAVRDAARRAPTRVGTWTGSDEPVPQSALTLLKPNAVVCRRFSNPDGLKAEMLLVQCRDPRDLVGHYPPACYPSQGWTLEGRAERQWQVEDLNISATEYTFSRAAGASTARICVADLMLLPDHSTAADMTGVRQFCKNHRLRLYGAGELQILVDGQLSRDQRESIYRELLGANRDVIGQILQGGKR